MKKYNKITDKDIQQVKKENNGREAALMLWYDDSLHDNNEKRILTPRQRARLLETLKATGGEVFYKELDSALLSIFRLYTAIVGYYRAEADTLAGIVILWRAALEATKALEAQIKEMKIEIPGEGFRIPIRYNDSEAATIVAQAKPSRISAKAKGSEKEFVFDGLVQITGLEMTKGGNLATYTLSQRYDLYAYSVDCKGVIAALEEYLAENDLEEFLLDNIADLMNEIKTNSYIKNRYDFPESYFHKLSEEERGELCEGKYVDFWAMNEEPTLNGVFFDYAEISSKGRYYYYAKTFLPKTNCPWKR